MTSARTFGERIGMSVDEMEAKGKDILTAISDMLREQILSVPEKDRDSVAFSQYIALAFLSGKLANKDPAFAELLSNAVEFFRKKYGSRTESQPNK